MQKGACLPELFIPVSIRIHYKPITTVLLITTSVSHSFHPDFQVDILFPNDVSLVIQLPPDSKIVSGIRFHRFYVPVYRLDFRYRETENTFVNEIT
jgi:hypothetical protein